jgi:hypothetical protein
MLFKGGDLGASIMSSVDVVEPLGDRSNGDEAGRVGNVRILLLAPFVLESGGSYRLMYQDIVGGWHETRFGGVSCEE